MAYQPLMGYLMLKFDLSVNVWLSHIIIICKQL